MILTHLDPLSTCWSVFTYGFDFAEILACAKKTPQIQLLREVKHDFCIFQIRFFLREVVSQNYSTPFLHDFYSFGHKIHGLKQFYVED